MARPEPYPRRIVKAIVNLFRDRMTDESYWHVQPLRVDRLMGPVDLKHPRPAILISGNRVKPAPGTNYEWQDELEVKVICLTEDAPEPDDAIEDLVADARDILRTEFRGIEGLVDSGWMFEEDVSWGVQQEEGKNGHGIGTVTLGVRYLSTAGTA